MKGKRITAVSLAALMASTVGLSVDVQAKEIMTSEHVDVVSVDAGDYDRDCYFYVPNSTAVGTRSCNSPIMIVFGDEKYTEETAIREAEESGIADIAAEEGSIIVFANPYDEKWDTVKDADVYAGIRNMFSDASGNNWVDGKYEGLDWMTGNQTTSYCGSSQRTYVFGDGNGADYVVENLLTQVYKTVEYPTGPVQAEITPTSYFISNSHNDITITYDGVEFPTAIINGTEKSNDAVKNLNPVHEEYCILSSSKDKGFDAAAIKEAYEKVGMVRRQSNTILEIPDYDALGISENVKTADVNGNQIEYREYIPDNLDLSVDGSIPLVMAFHGGGNTAEFFAWASEWPLIGKEEGFMVVAVQDHDSYTSADMVEILNQVEKDYPAIDKSRIYASGFSMGGVKSWNCGLKYSNVFAGVAPFDAGYSEEDVNNTEYVPITIPENANIMPLFFVGGTKSFAPELPHEEPVNVNAAIEAYFKMAGVTDNYVYDKSADEVWGYKADNKYTVENTEYPDCPLTVSEFASADGNTYISLGCIDKGHETMAVEARQAWKFLSKFSRNDDGTLTISDNTKETENQIDEKESSKAAEEANKKGRLPVIPMVIIVVVLGIAGVVSYRIKKKAQ